MSLPVWSNAPSRGRVWYHFLSGPIFLRGGIWSQGRGLVQGQGVWSHGGGSGLRARGIVPG